METIWFCIVAFMIAVYVLLDGFDLGAGAIHLWVAKTDEERRQVLASIGPVWDGNEVWLIAVGGTMYFAFPALYASGFSGFYLPLMIVLWLLILRGASIEFRNHIKSAVWDPLWDFLFCASSLLLAVFFGAALGNVVRGVPLDASGYFFRAAVDQFPPRGRNWNLGLVHDSRRRARFARAGDAWRALGTNENQWRSEFARGKTGWASLVGRDCFDDASDGGDAQGATASEGKLHRLARGISFPAGCSLGNRRSCFRIAKTQ